MNRAIRIGNASGFFGDRPTAMRELVEGGPLDVVTGDYLSEVTMTVLAKLRAKTPDAGYVPTFLQHLEPVLASVLEKKIKIVVNAGGLNPSGLVAKVRALAEARGLAPRIAWLDGDDLAPRLGDLRARGERFESLEDGSPLPSDPSFVVTAHAYLGAWGIARALAAGADIVVCPRVTDASLVVGPAAWWHEWKRDDWDALAGAVAAGHVIECGQQVTGGNYSRFQSIATLANPGFPIAEVRADGSAVITKHPGTGGAVTVGTVTAQLVYEVGEPRYANPDVVARLDTIVLEDDGVDRVLVRGTRGSPPPPTSKVAVTTRGPYRNELTLAVVGLDVDAKIALVESTTRALFADRATTLAFQRIGTTLPDATTQDGATTLLRIVATSDDEATVSRAFSAPMIAQALASYPGLFLFGLPGAASETHGYFPTTVTQSLVDTFVTLPDGTRERVLPPAITETLSAPPVPSAPAPRFSGAATRLVPLGTLVDARSGDKGSNANVGLWVSTDEAYAWLGEALTVETFRALVPEANGLVVERYALPNLRALNFVVRGLLLGGAVASLRFDRQAKALGEFVRARTIAIPVSLLDGTP